MYQSILRLNIGSGQCNGMERTGIVNGRDGRGGGTAVTRR